MVHTPLALIVPVTTVPDIDNLNVLFASPVPRIDTIPVLRRLPLAGTKIVGANGAAVYTMNVVALLVLTFPAVSVRLTVVV